MLKASCGKGDIATATQIATEAKATVQERSADIRKDPEFKKVCGNRLNHIFDKPWLVRPLPTPTKEKEP